MQKVVETARAPVQVPDQAQVQVQVQVRVQARNQGVPIAVRALLREQGLVHKSIHQEQV